MSREWTLNLPFTTPLSLNDRMHRMVKYRHNEAWKDAATVLARHQHIPTLERFTAVLHYAPRTNRRRDVDNLVAGLKPLVDGLIRAKVCLDDDHTRYSLTNPVIHGATGEPGRLWLVVVDLS